MSAAEPRFRTLLRGARCGPGAPRHPRGIIMLVAPCERTTTGRGCLCSDADTRRASCRPGRERGRGSADPAHPQRGHAPRVSHVGHLAKLVLRLLTRSSFTL